MGFCEMMEKKNFKRRVSETAEAAVKGLESGFLVFGGKKPLFSRVVTGDGLLGGFSPRLSRRMMRNYCRGKIRLLGEVRFHCFEKGTLRPTWSDFSLFLLSDARPDSFVGVGRSIGYRLHLDISLLVMEKKEATPTDLKNAWEDLEALSSLPSKYWEDKVVACLREAGLSVRVISFRV